MAVSDGGWAGLIVQFVSIYENIESMSRVGVSRSCQGQKGHFVGRSRSSLYFYCYFVRRFFSLPHFHSSTHPRDFHASSHFHILLPLPDRTTSHFLSNSRPDFVTLPHFLSLPRFISLPHPHDYYASSHLHILITTTLHLTSASHILSDSLPDFVTLPHYLSFVSLPHFQTSSRFHASSHFHIPLPLQRS